MPRIAGQGSKYIASALGAYAKGDRKHPTMRSIADSLSCNRAVAPRSHKASRPKQAGKWQDLTLAPLPAGRDEAVGAIRGLGWFEFKRSLRWGFWNVPLPRVLPGRSLAELGFVVPSKLPKGSLEPQDSASSGGSRQDGAGRLRCPFKINARYMPNGRRLYQIENPSSQRPRYLGNLASVRTGS